MKILYITNGYKPYRWAGTETYTAGIAEEVARKGHAVEILCGGQAWETGSEYCNGVSEDVQNGIPVRRINLTWKKSPDPFRYLYDNPVVTRYLANLLRQDRPNLVHITSCETLSASVIQVAKDQDLPVVLSLTDFWFLCPRINLLHASGTICDGRTSPITCMECLLYESGVYRTIRKILPEKSLRRAIGGISQHLWLTRVRGLRGMVGNMAERKLKLKQVLALPDIRITASNAVRDIFRANGVISPIEVQSYGHDLAWLGNYQGKVPSNRLRFGYIGQIMEAKGVHLLLHAVSRLSKLFSDRFSLVIYGDLEHAPIYGQCIKELASSCSNVSFGGTYPHSESARIFSGIDVLIVPSLWYDFPLIIYEAFATGTPVIATNLGGMAEAILHRVNGLLFEIGNVDDLVKQMQIVMEEPGFLPRLRASIPKVKSVSEEVSDLLQIYKHLGREIPNRIEL